MDPKSAPSPSSLPPLDDPLIRMLAKSIRHAVRILAVMMVLVIWWGGRTWPTCCSSATRTCRGLLAGRGENYFHRKPR